MANWIWAVGPWKAGVSRLPTLAGSGGPQVELGEASTRALKVKLLEPSEASFTTHGASAEAAVVEELISDLWVRRDGVALFRGRVTGPTRDELDGDKHTTTVEARDYREVLNRRTLYVDGYWPTPTEQADIAWQMISYTQGLDGGNLGIVKGTWPTTGVLRPDVLFKTGDPIFDSIKKLGAMAGGFDFDIDENLAANLYYPQRGTDLGTVLDWGGIIARVSRTFDPASYANAIRQSGADGVAAATGQVTNLATAPEGRWDAQYSDPQLATADMVTQTAATNLARASMPLPIYQLTLAKGTWCGPGHCWIGDYITVAVKAGRLVEVVKARIYEIDITVDPNGDEDVTVVAGDVRNDPRSVLRGISRRLNQVAKR